MLFVNDQDLQIFEMESSFWHILLVLYLISNN